MNEAADVHRRMDRPVRMQAKPSAFDSSGTQRNNRSFAAIPKVGAINSPGEPRRALPVLRGLQAPGRECVTIGLNADWPLRRVQDISSFYVPTQSSVLYVCQVRGEGPAGNSCGSSSVLVTVEEGLSMGRYMLKRLPAYSVVLGVVFIVLRSCASPNDLSGPCWATWHRRKNGAMREE